MFSELGVENEDTFEQGGGVESRERARLLGQYKLFFVVQLYKPTSCRGGVAYYHSLVRRSQKIARKILG